MEETRKELLEKLAAAEKVISAQRKVIELSDQLIKTLDLSVKNFESQVKTLEEKNHKLLAELVAAEVEIELGPKQRKPSLN